MGNLKGCYLLGEMWGASELGEGLFLGQVHQGFIPACKVIEEFSQHRWVFRDVGENKVFVSREILFPLEMWRNYTSGEGIDRVAFTF